MARHCASRRIDQHQPASPPAHARLRKLSVIIRSHKFNLCLRTFVCGTAALGCVDLAFALTGHGFSRADTAAPTAGFSRRGYLSITSRDFPLLGGAGLQACINVLVVGGFSP